MRDQIIQRFIITGSVMEINLPNLIQKNASQSSDNITGILVQDCGIPITILSTTLIIVIFTIQLNYSKKN